MTKPVRISIITVIVAAIFVSMSMTLTRNLMTGNFVNPALSSSVGEKYS